MRLVREFPGIVAEVLIQWKGIERKIVAQVSDVRRIATELGVSQTVELAGVRHG